MLIFAVLLDLLYWHFVILNYFVVDLLLLSFYDYCLEWEGGYKFSEY